MTPLSPTARLNRSFFNQPTLDVARELLGQRLVKIEPAGQRLSGWICETEAYIGTRDLGCHARAGRTARNASMWGPPGHAYVYFTYGMHWMLNLVTEEEGFPAAVLLRGLIPCEGIDLMRGRRKGRPDAQLTDGPAKLCQALGIDGTWDGVDLCRSQAPLFIERGVSIPPQSVTKGPRVGLNSVAEPWKSIPWGFRLAPQVMRRLKEEQGCL